MDATKRDCFLALRSHLLALSYQMLGELSAAEDIVQETWLRWNEAAFDEIRSPKAWLTSVATRIAIDYLRSARQRRETYTGTWLPEPVLETEPRGEGSAIEPSASQDFSRSADPAALTEIAQGCELALLWTLERLNEVERAAFLLRKVFDMDYADISGVLDRSEEACRQLVSRASRRVKEETPSYTSSNEKLEDTMIRFAAAATAGDKATVLEMLAPDVVAVSDGGGVVRAALIPLEGPERVAQVMTFIASKLQRESEQDQTALPTIGRANGRPAFVILEGTNRDMIMTLRTNSEGKISWIYTQRNPVKLAASRSRTG